MSALIPVEVIAEALAKHCVLPDGSCTAKDHVVDYADETDWRTQHERHQASVIAALPDIEVVSLPKPEDDDTVHPYWAVDDVNGPQQVRVTDSDGSCDENWVDIEFTARWRTVDADSAEKLGRSLLAAAVHARRKP